MEALGWTYDAADPLASWKALVAATQWWPDTRLTVEEAHDRLVLVVRLVTKDSHCPGTTVVITHRKPLGTTDRWMTPEEMERLLRERLREVACHEADEWVLIAGRRPFNPHAGVRV